MRHDVRRSARCWGDNTYGHFGIGATIDATATPTLVGTLSAIRMMDTGHTSCAIEGSAGDLYCWGRNTWGQIGDGTTTSRLSPRSVGLSAVSSVSTGGRITCAVAADGVYCWGDGPLGDGTPPQ